MCIIIKVKKELSSLSYEKELIRALKECIEIPSVIDENHSTTPYGKEINNALTYFLSLGDKMGFVTKNINSQCGVIEYGDGEESIGILVHCDVVPSGSGWKTNPFELVEEGGKLYGRGTIDDKGPALATLFALKRIKDKGIAGKRKVKFIIGTDE